MRDLCTVRQLLFPAQAAPTGAQPGLMSKRASSEQRMRQKNSDPSAGCRRIRRRRLLDPAPAQVAGMTFCGGMPTRWVDRDGVTAPSPMLAVKVDEILRMWKDDRPTDITDKPLPDPDELNAQIPVSEWEEGLDGKPRPPWAHYVVVYLVDPETATKYVYCRGNRWRAHRGRAAEGERHRRCACCAAHA